jgi:glycosyltransferase involved in cell wall biosynthesis
MKVAIVHDWLVVYGGAERVLEHLIDLYPQADIYSLIDFVPETQRHFLRGKTPKTSFIQDMPGARKHYRKMLPLMPLAIEQLDLTGYDLIISSSYCVAKGVLTGPNQVHVSYCHSPMRYAWDQYQGYLREMNLVKGLKSWFARWQLHRIRTWDVRSSNSVDQFLANSGFVARRIAKFYGRDSQVVYPPVDTLLFTPQNQKEDFYLAAGRLVPYKRIDLVVDAFARMPDRKLVVIGDGPEMEKISEKATPNVTLLGYQSNTVMRDHMARAKAFVFPAEEDFGIVPVEAQACGTPVIAFGRGGALETVRGESTDKRPTGLFFYEQTVESLCEAVERFEQMPPFDPQIIRAHAETFSVAAFKANILREVNAAILRFGPQWMKREIQS